MGRFIHVFRSLAVVVLSSALVLNVSHAEPSSKPWYSIKKIDELQIFINFPKYIMSIDSVYLFHLKFMIGHLKLDPSLHLYIYKKENRVSEARAKVIRNYMVNALGAPEDRVHILLENLRVEYNENTSERLRVLLTRSIFFKDAAPVGPEVILADVTKPPPPKKAKDLKLEVGTSGFISSFQEDFETMSLGLFFKLTFNSKKTLRFHIESEGRSVDDVDWQPEFRVAVGLDSVYDTVEIATQAYYKDNFTQSLTTSEFASYQDIGLAQKIWLKLIKRKSFIYKVGAVGEFSFSNNLEELQNSNVLTYGFEAGLYLKSNYNINLIYRKRKLRDIASFGNSSEHFGLSFSYVF